jgi:hypothetical protein
LTQQLVQEFFNRLPVLNELNVWLYKTTYYTAPVLAGKKPASILNFQSQLWEAYGKDIVKDLQFGVRLNFFEIRNWDSNTSVMFYNREHITAILTSQKNREFLRNRGYPYRGSWLDALECLKTRSVKACPHEIGIFLGIPIEDVTGFIENQGKGYLLKKYWKVYHLPERAQRIFNSYDRAKLTVVQRLLGMR